MMQEAIKQKKLDKSKLNYIVSILRRYGATKIYLFGSYARGDQRKDSDLDVLVEFGKRVTLIDLSHIVRIVKEDTGIQLDIVTKNALSPYLATYIEKDLKEIYLP
ncbi:MAG TPA: nucleotidyltransferase domain-containing protein [Caldisericia bacterium]|nr:nucleotidyltransferase domain-containing protein [Caldisericia bacterium]